LGDERERELGWFSWWLDAARPQPEESIQLLVLLAFFRAALHKVEKQFLLVVLNVVFGHLANCLLTIVVTIALDVPTREHSHFLIPCRLVLGKHGQKGILPCFSFSYFEFVRLAMIFD
jgi:hypothetical protein